MTFFKHRGTLFFACVLASFLLVSAAFAQTQPSLPLLSDTSDEEPARDTSAQPAEAPDCFDYYHFGSVTFSIDDDPLTNHTYRAGDTVRLTGAIVNPNDYPLPDGTVIAVIRREDDSVAADNWHPAIAQIKLPTTYTLPAGGITPFSFTWQIPAKAPQGSYQVEFFYLAGGKYVFSGLPYVQNFAGGRAFLTVRQPGESSAAHILRNTVRLNEEPLTLRSIPPTLDPGKPVVIRVGVTAQGSRPIPVTLTKALYAWSSTDPAAPVAEDQQRITLTPGVLTPLVFTWNDQRPGSYELVVTATPQDPAVLPSLVKIRFPVEGNTPRIAFSGIAGIEGDDVVVATCVVNGTYGEGEGSFTVQMDSDDSGFDPLYARVDDVWGGSIVALIPKDIIENSSYFDVQTVAKDGQGKITDQTTLSYPSYYLAARSSGTQLQAPSEGTEQVQQDSGKRIYVVLIIVGVILAVVASTLLLYRRMSTS